MKITTSATTASTGRLGRRTLLVGAVVAVTGVAISQAPASAGRRALEEEAAEILRAFLTARNAVLLAPAYATRPSAQDVDLLRRGTPTMLARERRVHRALVASRRALHGSGGPPYVKARCAVTVQGVSTQGAGATVRFTSHDELWWAGGGPGDSTAQVAPWVATFAREGDRWLLASLVPDPDQPGVGGPLNEPSPGTMD